MLFVKCVQQKNELCEKNIHSHPSMVEPAVVNLAFVHKQSCYKSLEEALPILGKLIIVEDIHAQSTLLYFYKYLYFYTYISVQSLCRFQMHAYMAMYMFLFSAQKHLH